MVTKIYVLKEPETLEVRYVGKTSKSLSARLVGHLHEAYNRHRVQFAQKNNWVKSIVDNFKLPIIELLEETYNDGTERESYWVNYYLELGNNLFNVTFNKNNILVRNDLRCKVYQYSKSGEFIKEWNSILEVEKELKIPSGNICRATGNCRFKGKEAGGFQWRRYKVDKIEIYSINSSKKPVYKYDLDGNFISSYSCARDTIKDGFNYKNVSQCCNMEKMSHGGFQWSFDKIDKLNMYTGRTGVKKLKSQDIVQSS